MGLLGVVVVVVAAGAAEVVGPSMSMEVVEEGFSIVASSASLLDSEVPDSSNRMTSSS